MCCRMARFQLKCLQFFSLLLVGIAWVSGNTNNTSNTNKFSPASQINTSSLAMLTQFKNNNVKVSSIVEKSITLTCSINLDNTTFLKAKNYRVNNRQLISYIKLL